MFKAVARLVAAVKHDRRGNVAIMAAIAMPVLVGSLGLSAEAASWYNGRRAMQNAADSAAIAAATNGKAETYAAEARAVAAQYGYVSGLDGVMVTASNTAACPGGGNGCYNVTISRAQRLLLAQAIGFGGDTTLGGQPAKLISASALAIQANAPREYCVLALAGSGAQQGIRANGVPKADLTGCSIMSNTDAVCNGHDLDADYGAAHGINNGCGNSRASKVDVVTDPYADLKSNIPADPCSFYHQAPKKKNDRLLPSTNRFHGLESRTSINICGDAELSGPVTISGGGTVLIIRNGSLDLKGYTLSTADGSALTIVFSGADNSRDHRPIGNGMFDIEAPRTGPWKGVAMYQDPRLTGGVDVSEAGNAPAWNITGLVYMPRASVTFSGTVNKASNGASCFGMVVDNLRINGTAEIFAHGECPRAGLTLPYSLVPSRGQLVS